MYSEEKNYEDSVTGISKKYNPCKGEYTKKRYKKGVDVCVYPF